MYTDVVHVTDYVFSPCSAGPFGAVSRLTFGERIPGVFVGIPGSRFDHDPHKSTLRSFRGVPSDSNARRIRCVGASVSSLHLELACRARCDPDNRNAATTTNRVIAVHENSESMNR